MAEDYSFTSKPMSEWSGDELENAFMWDLIDKYTYDDERHRRGFGAGPSLKRLEELSRHLEDQHQPLVPPSPNCVLCGKSGQMVKGQKIVYSSIKGRNTALDKKQVDGKIDWSCAECAGRTCSVCGSPHQLLMGLDMVDDKGVISHMAIFPVAPGCINPECQHHRNTGSE